VTQDQGGPDQSSLEVAAAQAAAQSAEQDMTTPPEDFYAAQSVEQDMTTPPEDFYAAQSVEQDMTTPPEDFYAAQSVEQDMTTPPEDFYAAQSVEQDMTTPPEDFYAAQSVEQEAAASVPVQDTEENQQEALEGSDGLLAAGASGVFLKPLGKAGRVLWHLSRLLLGEPKEVPGPDLLRGLERGSPGEVHLEEEMRRNPNHRSPGVDSAPKGPEPPEGEGSPGGSKGRPQGQRGPSKIERPSQVPERSPQTRPRGIASPRGRFGGRALGALGIVASIPTVLSLAESFEVGFHPERYVFVPSLDGFMLREDAAKTLEEGTIVTPATGPMIYHEIRDGEIVIAWR